MKDKRLVGDAEPYKLYYVHNSNTIYVGDGLPDVPKKPFCYRPFCFLLTVDRNSVCFEHNIRFDVVVSV